MDDAVAMAPPEQRAAMLLHEREVTSAAGIVVVSSRMLRSRLVDRFGKDLESKMVLVRNGVHPYVGAARKGRETGAGNGVTIGYAGTVAGWFDFDSVIVALEACPRTRLRIIGPRRGKEPYHHRIEYVPPVDHHELPALLAACDALIMPFKLDQVVTAVNPVKLYEYLAYGLPIIASRYDEIEREFGHLVEFYDTPEELTNLFRRLVAGDLLARGEPAAVEELIRASSWPERWKEIRRAGEAALQR